MIVWKAADNCDVTMVAALRLSDMSIQHVGHQIARVTASRGVYFCSPGKLFRGAMARESDHAPQNLRSASNRPVTHRIDLNLIEIVHLNIDN